MNCLSLRSLVIEVMRVIRERRSFNSGFGGALGCTKASKDPRTCSANLSIEPATAPDDGHSVGTILAASSSAGFIGACPYLGMVAISGTAVNVPAGCLALHQLTPIQGLLADEHVALLCYLAFRLPRGGNSQRPAGSYRPNRDAYIESYIGNAELREVGCLRGYSRKDQTALH